jgi:hypothetical protein
LLPVDEVIDRSDLLIVGVPHSSYRSLDIGNKPVVDLWGLYGGSIIPEPRPVAVAPKVVVRTKGARRAS